MSLVPAHWDLIKKIKKLIEKSGKEILLIGNGDVKDLEDAKEKALKYACDGIMIGRAVFGNPWFFADRFPAKNFLKTAPSETRGQGTHTFFENSLPEITEKLEVLVEHTKLFEKELGKHKSFAVMKKHFKAYVNGFEGAKELRAKLMETENAKEVEKITNDFLKKI